MALDRLKPLILIFGIAAVVVFSNLGGARLWDRDEPRNAGCAREMLERGDWIVPTFNGELRPHKPVLLYWCIMGAYSALGVNEFAARLPSALAAIVTLLCTFAVGRRLYDRSTALWAVMALTTSVVFVMVGRAATHDSLFVACTTLAMTIYVLGTFGDGLTGTDHAGPRDNLWFPRRTSVVVAMYAAMGLAALAKGPVGFLLPCAVIGQFRLLMRLPDDRPRSVTYLQRLQCLLRPFAPRHFAATLWSMRPLTLIAVVTVVAGPWYWAVGAATQGEFLRQFLLVHHVQRATQAMEGHAGNVLYYPATVLIGFFPWSVFTAPIGLDLTQRLPHTSRLRPATIFVLCWLAVYVALFSLARTKLPSYITPCFPALALLTGHYLSRWGSHAYSGRWLNIGLGCYAVIGALMCIAGPVAARWFLPGEEWLGAIGLAPLLGGVYCLRVACREQRRLARVVFAGSAVAFTTLIFAIGTERVDRHQQSHVLLEAIDSRTVNPRIATYDGFEPSWAFYSGRRITELPQYDVSVNDTRPEASPPEQLVEFLASSPTSFVITRLEHARELMPQLPPGVVVLAEANRFLSSQRLVVLGRDDPQESEVAQELTAATRQ